MSNVLIRDVPTDDLDRIRAAASQRGMTLQRYLLDTVRQQADHLRRRDALAHIQRRLQGRQQVTENDRKAIFDAIDAAHDERAGQLGGAHRT